MFLIIVKKHTCIQKTHQKTFFEAIAVALNISYYLYKNWYIW